MFFWSCGGKLGVHLELSRRPQGPARIASENSGHFPSCEGHIWFALELLLANRAEYRIQSVDSEVLSGGDRDLALLLQVQLGSQA